MSSRIILTLFISSLLINYAMTQCAAGQYGPSATTTTGSASCVACPQGTASASGAIVCINCPAGTSTTGTGTDIGANTNVPCATCTAGLYIAKGTAGAEQKCAACPANSYCPNTGGATTGSATVAGTAASTISTQCPPGYSSAVNAVQEYGVVTTAGVVTTVGCLPCAAGTYGQTLGAGCSTCPQGYYCTGYAAIQACPSGKTTASTGKTASSDCSVNSGAGALATSTFVLAAGVCGLLAL